jgi:hypothetical protein
VDVATATCPRCYTDVTGYEVATGFLVTDVLGTVVVEPGADLPPCSPYGAKVEPFRHEITLKPCLHVVEPDEFTVRMTAPRSTVPEIAHHAEVPAPFTVADVRALIDSCPETATLTVKTSLREVGSQRDPETTVTVLALCADWTTP